MNRYLIIFLFSLLLYHKNSFGQFTGKPILFTYEVKDLTKFLQKNIRFPEEFRAEEEQSINIACAKFIINERGNIDSVQIYVDTPESA